MGHVFPHIAFSNPRKPEIGAVEARALVDAGALMLSIPRHLVQQPDLETDSPPDVSAADRGRRKALYVRPAKAFFETASPTKIAARLSNNVNVTLCPPIRPGPLGVRNDGWQPPLRAPTHR